MNPDDFIAELYRALLKQGWTMGDIDAMDVFYYLLLLRKEAEPEAFIDDILG